MTAWSSLLAAVLDLDSAGSALERGDVVLFPTETFFGMGCDAFNDAAVASVFALKRRKHTLPLPVVVSSLDMLGSLVSHVSEAEAALMERFWPGPLSLLLPAAREVPELLTAGSGYVAVRFSPHPAACDLCDALGSPVVASSANISGQPPVCASGDISPELQLGVAGLYARGPEPAGGLPSTVMRVEGKGADARIHILRPGVIDAVALREAGFTVARE